MLTFPPTQRSPRNKSFVNTRNLLWLVSLVSAAPLYAADVPANTPLAPQQVFRYNNHSDPGTLDPKKVEENTAAQIVLDVFECMDWLAGDGQEQPAQAEPWEIRACGMRYNFHLRSGLQWSDCQPLTAEDFVLGWQRAVDPKTASPFAGYLAQAHIRIMSTAKSCISRHIDAFIAVGARPAALFTLISCDSTRQIM